MEVKFKQIETGETRDGLHVLYGLDENGKIWEFGNKGWVKVPGPIIDEE